MSDDNSNDIVILESEEGNSNSGEAIPVKVETRPLMLLLQRLISNESNQNTVLTNIQIISILNTEYNIDVTTIHELKADIYLNIVKKFLKNWPQWDEFDRIITLLRKKQANKTIKKTLEDKYMNLKEYLKIQLDATRLLAEEAVKKVESEHAKKMELVDTSDVVLEIACTRKQLNELISKYPNTALENNIFNLPDAPPNAISLQALPIECLLNWWGVRVAVEMKFISYSRTTRHQLKHVLVNKKNGPRTLNQVLNDQIQIKDQKRATIELHKWKINQIFERLVKNNMKDLKMYCLLRALADMIKSDMKAIEGKVKVSATYRQHPSQYRYYRKLRKEVATTLAVPSGSNYDLYIEETLAPMHVFHIGKIGYYDAKVIPANFTWLTIECAECKCKFTGIDLYSMMKDHFDVYHANEPDWVCTNCEKSFTMVFLTQNSWRHNCTE